MMQVRQNNFRAELNLICKSVGQQKNLGEKFKSRPNRSGDIGQNVNNALQHLPHWQCGLSQIVWLLTIYMMVKVKSWKYQLYWFCRFRDACSVAIAPPIDQCQIWRFHSNCPTAIFHQVWWGLVKLYMRYSCLIEMAMVLVYSVRAWNPNDSTVLANTNSSFTLLVNLAPLSLMFTLSHIVRGTSALLLWLGR